MGRKVEFDTDLALESITHEFWKNGFHQTSMTNIESATGVKKASLYGVFGDKAKMFELSIEKYYLKSSSMNKSRGIDFIYAFFNRLIKDSKSSKSSKGCLIMNSVLEFSSQKCDKWQMCFEFLEKIRLRLKEEIEYSIMQKKISCDTDSDSISKWLLSQAFMIRELSKFTNDKTYFGPIHIKIKEQLEKIKI